MTLKVEQLSHSYGPCEVLEDINFCLEQGRVLSVVGPSGGGKTTLLHLCGDLMEVTEGRIDNQFDSTAFAFQEPRLLPWQSTLDNIAYGLKARGVGKKERLERATDIALRFGLEREDLEKFPKDLSGGMRQRVSFARALVVEPQLLFLDEPFSALDIGLKQELQQILIEQVANKDLTILFITHDLMEAVRLSDQILLLAADPGRIVQTFDLVHPKTQRNDIFVYEETARLLSQPHIVETFELNTNA
ncbi:MAG: ABC transporter ATP-binding protein [Proteobacteria bacterium]|nr:MAG: ABC transporter ATP-binding protein [Pseudomonadota bacterium]